MIRFACPKCRTAFRVPAEKAGKRTTCPACELRMRIPGRKRLRGARRREMGPADDAAAPGLLPYVVAGCVVAALIVVVALAGAALARPGPGEPAPASASLTPAPARAVAPSPAADPAAENDPPDPELFETPPRNYRSLPAAEQARLVRKYEPNYLDPTAADREHIAAANALLGLPRGSASLLKGLDVYEGRPEHQRRYRWCLLYLCVVQHDKDASTPTDRAELPGLIPARHVTAMLGLIRDIDPDKRPDRAGQFFTALTYLGRHGEQAAALLPTLRVMHDRFAGGNDAVAREIQDAIRGIEQRQ
jgi:hypothetical protein